MNELKIDKSLLVNNFDTYKLSLETFRISKENIPGEIGIKYPNERQFSFFHHKEFSLHNHLYNDSWNDNDVYFITSERKVKKGLINFQTEKLFGLVDVWEIPAHSCTTCNFNASLKFPSADTAVLTDGQGFLYILNTSNRIDIQQWKTLHSEKVFEEETEFKVICSQLDNTTSGNRNVHCILLLIENSKDEAFSHKQASGFETILKWVVFTEGAEGVWEKRVLNEFRGQGSVDYISLESACQALYLISDKEFKSPLFEKEEETSRNQQNGGALNPDYQWQQSSDEVKLWINSSSDDKSDFKIDTTCNSIRITLKENLLLSGLLFHRINPELTTWSFENSKLEVIMQKEQTGLGWAHFINDSDKIGAEIINEEFVSDVHEKLKHLSSENEEQGDAAMLNSGELEECDAFGENRILRRYGISGRVTHKIFLGSDQWLFTLPNVSDILPAFCMRRDVDGIVWQPEQPKEDSTLLECTHVHTFPAFGYIAASKQEKKFLVAPPNFSYVAVVNSIGHVISFRKTDMRGDSVLRNRKTHKTTNCLYLQNLINLDSNNQIFGAAAFNKYLFVLTTKQLIMINITDS